MLCVERERFLHSNNKIMFIIFLQKRNPSPSTGELGLFFSGIWGKSVYGFCRGEHSPALCKLSFFCSAFVRSIVSRCMTQMEQRTAKSLLEDRGFVCFVWVGDFCPLAERGKCFSLEHTVYAKMPCSRWIIA